MANKYSNKSKIEKRTIKFTLSWTGDRVPVEIKLPSGKNTKIVFMRDGKIALESGENGTYFRFWDNKKTNEHTVEIEIEE